MKRDQLSDKRGRTRDIVEIPLIIGLIVGVTLAAMTEQWWWATVGVLAGAAVGAIGTYGRHRSAR